MSRLEASKSFLKSLVAFIEEEEVPTTRRSRRLRKPREDSSSDAVRASSSRHKQPTMSFSRSSLGSVKEDSVPQESAISNSVLESKLTSTATPASEARTIISAETTTTTISEQDFSIVATATRKNREQEVFTYLNKSEDDNTLEIQNFKFHNLGLPSTEELSPSVAPTATYTLKKP